MMRRPMTTEELFNKIYGILKEKGKLSDDLDYGLPAGNALPIKTSEFELKSELAYGASEGIYLDLWIRYLYEDVEYKKDLGTFKTLRDDGEAIHMMASLLADFIIELNDYVHANIDDFCGKVSMFIRLMEQESVWDGGIHAAAWRQPWRKRTNCWKGIHRWPYGIMQHGRKRYSAGIQRKRKVSCRV